MFRTYVIQMQFGYQNVKKNKIKRWILIQEFILQNSLIYADTYNICNEKNTNV